LINTLPPDRNFYFLHIPKTAGTTFSFSVLPKLFDADAICPAHDYPELLPLVPSGLEKYRLFRGHFYYFFTRLLPEKPVFMTFLRDPVERILSLYDHICRDSQHYQYAEMRSLKNGLRDAIRSPWLLPPNFQVSALACDLDPIATMNSAQASQPDTLDESSVIYREMTKRIPTRDDLKIARARLGEMDFVGIVEQFDASVRVLCNTFGWATPDYERMNVAPARTRGNLIEPAILKEIVKANDLDIELYEFARSLS
jgi:hypothetical protein